LDRGFIFEFGLKVPLGVPCGLAKEVKHFGFFRGEIVIINLEFSLYLDSPVLKGRVCLIGQWWRVRKLGGF